jgi:glycosyltransferase involved in cell wall biosynthesis
LLELMVADYPGHPGQVQLSRALAARGLSVCHVYCPDVPTGRGDLSTTESTATNLEIVPIGLGATVERYRPWRRIRQETRWGWLLGRFAWSRRPSALVISNLPLLSQLVVTLMLRRTSTDLVLWQQDVHSIAIAALARRKLGRLGLLVQLLARALEALPARSATAVLVISPAFRPVLESWGVDTARVWDFPNWPPIEELPLVEPDNAWREAAGLSGKRLVLYAGTLGLKHDPDILVRIADRLRAIAPDATLLVVSEGNGREYLDAVRAERQELPIMTMDYQPYDQLPAVLASADLLVAVLESDAGEFSVPSKVLTYLCAGRPILAAVPPKNLAAGIIAEAGAGIVLDPAEAHGERLTEDLSTLLDPARAAAYGKAARSYAEREFDVENKADAFLSIMSVAVPEVTVRRSH